MSAVGLFMHGKGRTKENIIYACACSEQPSALQSAQHDQQAKLQSADPQRKRHSDTSALSLTKPEGQREWSLFGRGVVCLKLQILLSHVMRHCDPLGKRQELFEGFIRQQEQETVYKTGGKTVRNVLSDVQEGPAQVPRMERQTWSCQNKNSVKD